jgi:hypothetical protein
VVTTELTTPVVEPVETTPPVSGGGGTISPFFALLSVAGFAGAAGVMARQWHNTRGER